MTQADATLKPPGALVILPDALYFSIASKGEVYRCTTADKCSPIATGLGSPGEMIADTEYLYVSDAAKGQVVRYRLGEPAPNAELIVRDTPGVGPLVVTGNYLYIATRKAAGAAQAQILSAMKAP